jgi:multiple sugar transport system ATP-binding protein
MNFFTGRLVKGDGKLHFDGGSFTVEIPSDRLDRYMPYANKPVILGVRPESIYDPKYVSPGIFVQPVEGQIDLTELMGNEIFLYVTSGSHNFVARVDPRSSISMGSQATVVFNMNNMHLFDPDTEHTIR